MHRISIFSLIAVILYAFFGCDESVDDKDQPVLQGTVYNYNSSEVIANQTLFLIANNEHFASTRTGADGSYRIENIDHSGSLDILCSVLNYKDTIVTVSLAEGKVSNSDFHLIPDNATGTLRGELQYDSLFTLDPLLEFLSDQEIHDGVTGATLQSEWTDPNATFPPFIMMGEDTLWPPVDTYGRFRINLPIGTYPFTAIAQGFNPTSRVKKIYTDSTVYISFVLGKE